MGITRSTPVSAKIRGTFWPDMASTTWPPVAWACLCASTRAWIPAESQNRVPLMSTTNVGCSAASSRAARSPAALVISTSSGAVTTGTPRTNSTGKRLPRICLTSGGPDRLPAYIISIAPKPDTCQ